ncbi:MAG: bifunctional UDP-N-acetylmuramoyl-tripeptide:D-alanyl-D-alanine ligase/alanine racemase [Prolixibacteraceae bacterium]|jgi:alanine racemase|nr:bifunctional UDP-N-acetylmuramoyl-tripeptide:D-alanyl-D-alanine ligase/alanine racemase [Prolixibacteraceae bacterium]
MTTNLSISKIIGAQLLHEGPELSVAYLSTDSRSIVSGLETLFFALVTQRNNGHNYIRNAYNKGVRSFVVSDSSKKYDKYADATIMKVDDTLEAFQQLAAAMRQDFKGNVIGITGSNGKTIVKEWLSELLVDDYRIIRSPKSYNSQIGVPHSVWLLNNDADMAFLEAGISQPGEMEKLEEIIRPRYGIITNIGEAHQSNFESVEQKVEEKLKLFRNSEVVIYRKDYPAVDSAIKKMVEENGIVPISWSMMDETADLFIYFVQKIPEGCGIIGQVGEKQYAISIPFSDDASVENAITCLAALIAIGKDQDQILERFSTLQPIAMRLEIRQGINQCIIINDSYNSDLSSLSIALDTLDQQASEDFMPKTLILSDIYYSSKPDEELYAEVAQLVKLRAVERFIGIGLNLKRYRDLFADSAQFFSSTADFLTKLPAMGLNNEVILLKGARDFHFDQIASMLQDKAHETVLEIDMSAMVENLNYFKSKLKPETKIMVMVKAFSYGSGMAEIARLLEFHQVNYLAVAIADEGVALRKAGITLPIVVMNPEQHSFDMMFEHLLEPNIYSKRLLEQFLTSAQRNALSNFPIHVKIDTGMKRLGFESEGELQYLLEKVKRGNVLHIKSVFTHLSASDDPGEDNFTQLQFHRFEKLAKIIQENTDHHVLKHVLNSAGIERFPNSQYDMVRLGIGLYGISHISDEEVQNVSTLKTTISQIRTVPKGETIGYGRAGVAASDMQIATLPIGYADGFNRRLSNGKGKVWVNGKLAPVVGTVCMDMCMVDITGIETKEGDRVIVFGKEYPATEMAKALDTIPYEIFTSISQRVKRVYFQE